MGIGAALVGVGATLLSKMLALKAWSLQNVSTGEMLKGQFPAEEVSRAVGGNWAEIQALNRQTAFLQFLNGKTQTLAVRSRFYKRDMFDDSPVERIEKLIEWTMILPSFRRPPLLTFFLGDGLGLQMDVILEGVSDIRYSEPNALGGIRQVSFTLEMRRWSRSALIAADQEVTDTRYARAKTGDYYELLCEKEYGDAMVGVVIRQRHPTQPLLVEGDIVKLPALEGVRGTVPTQQSLIFAKAFGRRDTPQKRLRLQWMERRAKSFVAHDV